MPRGDESYRISLHYKALSSSTVWVVCHLLGGGGVTATFDHIQKRCFPKKKSDPQSMSSPLRFPILQPWCQDSWSCFSPSSSPPAITPTRCKSACVFTPFCTLRHWKASENTHYSLRLLCCCVSLRKLNSDFFRSSMAVGCTHCRHIVAVDEKTQRGPLMSFQQKSTRSI